MNESNYSSSSSSSFASSPSEPENPGLTVRYSTTVPEEHNPIYNYALKAEVVSSEGYPDHIFVFQRSTENNEGDSKDEFIQIASPLDAEELPENAPDLLHGMPYYRAKEVTLWFRTMEDLELAKDKMREDIKVLVKTYNVLSDTLDAQEDERYE